LSQFSQVNQLGAQALGAGAARVIPHGGLLPGALGGAIVGGLEPPGAAAAPNVVTVAPGMTMAQIERASIEAALRETRGNRRKAADLLDIGERTLYRKLKEYGIPVDAE
jgi:transcriptional regulator of acetoin/glycerol metabolism